MIVIINAIALVQNNLDTNGIHFTKNTSHIVSSVGFGGIVDGSDGNIKFSRRFSIFVDLSLAAPYGFCSNAIFRDLNIEVQLVNINTSNIVSSSFCGSATGTTFENIIINSIVPENH